MRNNIGKTAALATALTLALALAGCGRDAGSSTSSAESVSAVSQRGQAVVQIYTEGVGEIAWAYEGEEVAFEDEYPMQSAYVADAYGQTIGIEAREDASYEGYHFVKWNKDGKKFSEDRRIDVLVDGDAEYVAIFWIRRRPARRPMRFSPWPRKRATSYPMRSSSRSPEAPGVKRNAQTVEAPTSIGKATYTISTS